MSLRPLRPVAPGAQYFFLAAMVVAMAAPRRDFATVLATQASAEEAPRSLRLILATQKHVAACTCGPTAGLGPAAIPRSYGRVTRKSFAGLVVPAELASGSFA